MELFKKMSKYDHIIIDGLSFEIYCKICGEKHKFRLPMIADDFLKMGKRFIAIHKPCLIKKKDI